MRNELIPKVLKEYRKRNHYSVKDVSIRLMEHDIDVAPTLISFAVAVGKEEDIIFPEFKKA